MLTPEEQRAMAESMLDLSQELHARSACERLDPGPLMRLMAAGIAQCLLALATQMVLPPATDIGEH